MTGYSTINHEKKSIDYIKPDSSLSHFSTDSSAPLQKAINSLNAIEAGSRFISEIPDIIYQWAFDELGEESIVGAQQEFQHLTGKFFSDDDFYKVRLRYFIEYFLFERLQKFKFLSHLTSPAFAFFQSQTSGSVNPDVLHKLLELRNINHSLFKIIKTDQNNIYINDLLVPATPTLKIEPLDNQFFVGLEKNDIFQCHIFRVDHSHHLSDGMILHSKKSLETITEIVKNKKDSNEHGRLKFLFQCANGQLTMIRRKSISAQYAYRDIK